MSPQNLTKGQRGLLEKAYFTPGQAGSFTSPQTLRNNIKKQKSKKGKSIKTPSLQQIQQWLLEKRPYTLHRPARRKYPMKKVIVSGVNTQLQGDLIDMQPWASKNDDKKYILIVIDCFSRYAYVRPLPSKHGNLVAEALLSIIDEAEERIDRKIKRIQVDEGKEFYNKHVKEMLDKKHIALFSTKSPTKAQMVERLIRTMRGRQERYNTFKGKRRWVDSFAQLIKSYNRTTHSALPKNMTPEQVNLENERQVWTHLYKDEFSTSLKSLSVKLKKLQSGKPIDLKPVSSSFKVGDPVRLSKRKVTFEKAYYQNWTDEIFFIAQVSNSTKPVTYRIADIDGEQLEGIFYKHELTPVRFKEKLDYKQQGIGKVYAVEKVLKEEIRKDGKKYLFVKWRGYPDSQNSWIRSDQFMSIREAT